MHAICRNLLRLLQDTEENITQQDIVLYFSLISQSSDMDRCKAATVTTHPAAFALSTQQQLMRVQEVSLQFLWRLQQ
jgi:hypothetical protein